MLENYMCGGLSAIKKNCLEGEKTIICLRYHQDAYVCRFHYMYRVHCSVTWHALETWINLVSVLYAATRISSSGLRGEYLCSFPPVLKVLSGGR